MIKKSATLSRPFRIVGCFVIALVHRLFAALASRTKTSIRRDKTPQNSLCTSSQECNTEKEKGEEEEEKKKKWRLLCLSFRVSFAKSERHRGLFEKHSSPAPPFGELSINSSFNSPRGNCRVANRFLVLFFFFLLHHLLLLFFFLRRKTTIAARCAFFKSSN